MLDSISQMPNIQIQPLTHRHLLPSISAVYFICRASECLYIGQTTDLKSRFISHEIIRQIGDDQCAVYWLELSCESLAVIEQQMIRQFAPPYNVNGKGQRTRKPGPDSLQSLGLIGLAEAARVLGVSLPTVYAEIDRGRLRTIRAGKRLRLIEAESLRECLAARTLNAPKAGRPRK